MAWEQSSIGLQGRVRDEGRVRVKGKVRVRVRVTCVARMGCHRSPSQSCGSRPDSSGHVCHELEWSSKVRGSVGVGVLG